MLDGVPEASVKESLIQVEELSLRYRLNLHRGDTWRDRFVRTLSARRARECARWNEVLRGVSFELRRGDRVGLLGANGAGKSTLCRCVAGFLRPDFGGVKRSGKVRAIFEPAAAVNPELTGRENAWLLAKLYYPWVADPTALVEEAVVFSGLGELADAPFKTYSNGMQARLGLSIVSALPSDILILDEVFGGADARFQERITARFLQLVERSGAVLFVSHAPQDVRRVCNRVLILDGGRISFDGGVEEGLRVYQGQNWSL